MKKTKREEFLQTDYKRLKKCFSTKYEESNIILLSEMRKNFEGNI